MKRGYIILISGAALLVAGISASAAWGVSFAGAFVRDNTIVAKTMIDAGKSISAQTEISQLDRPISLAIGIDKNGQQQFSNPSDIRLKAAITDPNGNIASSNEFGESFLTSLNPRVTGVYTVTVMNLGTKPVIVSGSFGHMPFIGTDGKPDIDAMAGGQGLGMIIIGGGLAAVGIITLIAGGIITAIDGRTRGDNTTTTTRQGGINYRKD